MEQQLTFFLALAVGLIFGSLAVWLMLRADTKNAYGRAYSQARTEFGNEISKLTERLSGKDSRIEELLKDRDQLKTELERQHRQKAELQSAKAELEARLAEGAKLAEEKLAVVEQAEKRLSETFQALSAHALKSNNEAFLQLARSALDRYQEGARSDLDSRQKAIEEILRPVREALGKVDSSIEGIGKDHAGITRQVELLQEAQNMLRSETSNLVNALRTPSVRGRWGEIQLRRVVEMAGMVAHCDFEEQVSVETDNGRLRPDLVVQLPNGRQVVVDAKVSMKAYLEAMTATDDEQRVAKLKEHAAQVRSHLQRLGGKSYWEQFSATPEFVVAFIPGEAFFSAALEQDSSLIEYGVDNRVILATPTTLIALLRSVAYGWRQEKLTANAHEISELGKTVYDRLCTFTQHLETMRINLQRTVDGYNRAVGSLESRVLVSARRFQDLGAGSDREVPALEPVDNFPRSLQAVERAVASDGFGTLLEEAPEAESELDISENAPDIPGDSADAVASPAELEEFELEAPELEDDSEPITDAGRTNIEVTGDGDGHIETIEPEPEPAGEPEIVASASLPEIEETGLEMEEDDDIEPMGGTLEPLEESEPPAAGTPEELAEPEPPTLENEPQPAAEHADGSGKNAPAEEPAPETEPAEKPEPAAAGPAEDPQLAPEEPPAAATEAEHEPAPEADPEPAKEPVSAGKPAPASTIDYLAFVKAM